MKESSSKFSLSGGLKLSALFGGSNEVEASIAKSVGHQKSESENEEFTKTKSQYLTNGILKFRTIIENISRVLDQPIYLFFDDLYHVQKSEQAKLIDYFHKIMKGNNGFIKIGTIKTRSNWYEHVPQPISMKIGDDADEINLDKTLERFLSTKAFLKNVLKQYNQKANGSSSTEFISETGLDRLVLASGGVARDFLGLFRRSIAEGRERLRKDKNHHRGQNYRHRM